MLLISFKGIQTKEGNYLVEVSHTADTEPRLMEVSKAFFMSIPAELMTRTLDTFRNKDLRRQQELKPDVRFVRTLRDRFGDKMLSGEPITYDTHLNIMEDRKILLPCSSIDKDGVQRYSTSNASYETISMICPLSSHLVGFATMLGKPAMIFMTPHADQAKRPEDKENDSILMLEDDARKVLYFLDELRDPAGATHDAIQMQYIIAHIHSQTQYTPAEPTAFDEEKTILNIVTEVDTKNSVAALESIFDRYQNLLKTAKEKREEINDIVTTIKTSWAQIQERKSAQAHEEEVKEAAVAALIAAGERSVAKDVIDRGLPVESDLMELISTRQALVEQMADNERLQPEEEATDRIIPAAPIAVPPNPMTVSTLPTTPCSTLPVPNAEGIRTPVRETKPTEPDDMLIDSDEKETSIAQRQTLATSTPVSQPAPIAIPANAPVTIQDIVRSNGRAAVISEPVVPAFRHPLQNLIDRAETILLEVTVAVSTIASLRRDATEAITSIQDIVNQVKQAKAQRNKEIINWPEAKDLISTSKLTSTHGYAQWKWYYSHSPELVVKYVFNLMLETKRWDDLAFKSVSQEEIPTLRIPFKQAVVKSYQTILFKWRPVKRDSTLALAEDAKNIISLFLFGKPKPLDATTRIYKPKPMLAYKNIIAGQAEVKVAEDHLKKLCEIVDTVNIKAIEAEKEKHAALQKLLLLRQTANEAKNEDQVRQRIKLETDVQILNLRADRLFGTKRKAIQELELSQNVLSEKRRKVNELNSIEAPAEEEKTPPPVVTQSVAALSQAKPAPSKIELELLTNLSLNNKAKFLALIASNSHLIPGLKTACMNKARLQTRLTLYLKELQMSVEVVSRPTLRIK
jgi:hypothetical protein